MLGVSGLGRQPAQTQRALESGAVGSYAIANDGTRIYFETFSPGGDWAASRDSQPNARPPVLLVMGLGANGRL